jgi:hypothetical protein
MIRVELVVGRPVGPRPLSPYERTAPAYPEYDLPVRAAASDPEADAAFLRQVRERAEEQRRRYRESRRAEDGADPDTSA